MEDWEVACKRADSSGYYDGFQSEVDTDLAAVAVGFQAGVEAGRKEGNEAGHQAALEILEKLQTQTSHAPK